MGGYKQAVTSQQHGGHATRSPRPSAGVTGSDEAAEHRNVWTEAGVVPGEQSAASNSLISRKKE